MAADLLEQGDERPGGRSRARTAVGALAVVALLGAGALQVAGDAPAVPPAVPEPPPPLPRVWLDRAGVLGAAPSADGVLRLQVGLEGVPRAELLSLDVELPGSAVVLRPVPDRLADDGRAVVGLDVLPRCPDALPGLSRAAVRAVVRGRVGGRARQVRVRLDTAGAFADAVRGRCGAVAGVPGLRTSSVELDGPVGDPLRTRVEVASTDAVPVTVVGVRPGPGLTATVTTGLPLVVAPGAQPVPVGVELRPGGCGGAPDTPPYVLVLSTGEVVATSVAPEAQPSLDALRPYRCAG